MFMGVVLELDSSKYSNIELIQINSSFQNKRSHCFDQHKGGG